MVVAHEPFARAKTQSACVGVFSRQNRIIVQTILCVDGQKLTSINLFSSSVLLLQSET